MKRNSKEHILNTFFQLLQIHNLDDIDIRRITDACEISRSTFYNYYPDKYALLNDLFLRWVPIEISHDIYGNYMGLIAKLRLHRDVVGNVYHSTVRTALEDHIRYLTEQHLDRALRAMPEVGEISNPCRYHLITFFGYAITGIVMQWMRDGFHTHEQPIEETIYETLKYAIPAAIRAYEAKPMDAEMAKIAAYRSTADSLYGPGQLIDSFQREDVNTCPKVMD